MSKRKPGKRKENYDDESTAEVLKKSKALFRTDWGGNEKIGQIQKQMLEGGIKCGPESAAVIGGIVDKQVEGIKKRAFPRIDEGIKRVSNSDGIIEELP